MTEWQHSSLRHTTYDWLAALKPPSYNIWLSGGTQAVVMQHMTMALKPSSYNIWLSGGTQTVVMQHMTEWRHSSRRHTTYDGVAALKPSSYNIWRSIGTQAVVIQHMTKWRHSCRLHTSQFAHSFSPTYLIRNRRDRTVNFRGISLSRRWFLKLSDFFIWLRFRSEFNIRTLHKYRLINLFLVILLTVERNREISYFIEAWNKKLPIYWWKIDPKSTASKYVRSAE